MRSDATAAEPTPLLSIIIVLYNMRREARRSLFSLSASYQDGINASDYEVIVVDNGSDPEEAPETVTKYGPNFRLHSIAAHQALPSPCTAINQAVAQARGHYVGIMVDGARIASPGILHLACQALEKFDRTIVATIGFHIGATMQKWAAQTGYDQAVEDALLKKLSWRQNGYRLFEAAALTGVNWQGWFGPMAESNLLFLSREMYAETGGFDPGFELPGGELCNLDFYNKASSLPESTLVSLFGEATFHQIHGGAMSSLEGEHTQKEVQRYMERYRARHGQPFQFSQRSPLLFGQFRPELKACLAEVCRPDRPLPSAPPTQLLSS